MAALLVIEGAQSGALTRNGVVVVDRLFHHAVPAT
jgi:hypothetical protein